MIFNKVVIYIIAFLFALYCLRSLIAGIRKEKRRYWISIEYDLTKKVFGEHYDRAWNIIMGILGLIISITIFIFYLQN